jgi:opacity protein-like surface antigen
MRRFLSSCLPGLSAAVLLALFSSSAIAAAPTEDGRELTASGADEGASAARGSRPHGHSGSSHSQGQGGQHASQGQADHHAAPPAQAGRPDSVSRHVPGRAPSHNVVDHQPGRSHPGPAAHQHMAESRAAAAHHSVERRYAAARHSAVARDHAAHRAWASRHSWHPGWHGAGWGHPHWATGVFVFGPAPWYHETVVVGGQSVEGATAEPERQVDRTRSFSIGVRGGSYLSGYHGGPGYGDFGMGLAARYRASEALGFELAWQYHDQSWTEQTERINAPLSASVELFAFPWTRFNPYVFAGLTWTGRNYQDPIYEGGLNGQVVSINDSLFGPQGGIGLEFGVGERASVNLESRFIGYVNKAPEDPSRAGAVQANLGFNFYF